MGEVDVDHEGSGPRAMARVRDRCSERCMVRIELLLE